MKTVSYRDKFTSANTVYADIEMNAKLYMLDRVAGAYYDLLEDANYSDLARQALSMRDPKFRKHSKSNDRQLHNSVQSFLAGLLRQHQGKPNKDISVKMLPGIELATEVLNKMGYDCEHYTFLKETNSRQNVSAFDKLFQS